MQILMRGRLLFTPYSRRHSAIDQLTGHLDNHFRSNRNRITAQDIQALVQPGVALETCCDYARREITGDPNTTLFQRHAGEFCCIYSPAMECCKDDSNSQQNGSLVFNALIMHYHRPSVSLGFCATMPRSKGAFTSLRLRPREGSST